MKKTFTKILGLVLTLAVIVGCVCAFAACGNNPDEIKYDVIAATDLLKEDFGIAMKKGDTATKTVVDEVITQWLADGTMTKYSDYYTALDKYEHDFGEKPEENGLKLTWNFTGTENIVMYTEAGFAPYEFTSANGKIVGVDVAIMSEVAEKMGKKLKIENVDFITIPQMVKNADGIAVGAAGMTITEERAESVEFSKVYASSTVVIVSKTGISSIADLAGKKVGVQGGTSGDTICTKAKDEGGYKYTNEDNEEVVVTAAITEITPLKTYAMLKNQLANGLVDAIVMDKLPAELLFAGQIK